MKKILAGLIAIACIMTSPTPQQAADDDKEQAASQAYAVFSQFCSGCHSPKHPHGNKKYSVLDWESLTKEKPTEKIMKKHKDAKAYIVPKKPAESLIWIRLSKKEMPPEDEPQPAEADRAAVKKWIELGAPKDGFKGGS